MSAPLTSYDEIPYESFPYAFSHPNRLGVVATLFGMAPAPVNRCRVLELGCAAGGNLIPIAQRFPESEFVGIDLSSRQVEQGQKVINMLGLTNCQLICGDIATATKDLGMFDYIVCHGVWSWVPAPVRESIFRIAAEQLNPQGVAFISYNTFPGWHLRGIVREMMSYHCRNYATAAERVAHARAMLDFLVRMVPEEKSPYGMLLKNEADILRNKSDSYLAHEHLEDNNHPVYFHEFDAQATAAGMQYLGEADLMVMTAEPFGAEAKQVLGRIAKTVAEYEQYIDFLRNRTFRQTLLVHKGVAITRRVAPDRVFGLRIGSAALAPDDLQTGDNSEAKFRNAAGSLGTSSPLFKTVLKELIDIWPHTLSFDELMIRVRQRMGSAASTDTAQQQAEERSVATNLIDCFTRRYVELYTTDPGCESAAGERPTVDRLARLQADYSGVVYTGLHSVLSLNDLQRQIARLADGTRTRDQIVDQLNEQVQAGTLVVQQAGETITDTTSIRPQLAQAVEQNLMYLAKQGLLVPQEVAT